MFRASVLYVHFITATFTTIHVRPLSNCLCMWMLSSAGALSSRFHSRQQWAQTTDYIRGEKTHSDTPSFIIIEMLVCASMCFFSTTCVFLQTHISIRWVMDNARISRGWVFGEHVPNSPHCSHLHTLDTLNEWDNIDCERQTHAYNALKSFNLSLHRIFVALAHQPAHANTENR